MAFDLRPRSHPGAPLLLGQLAAPCPGDGSKRPPRVPPRRRAGVPGDDIPAPEQLPAPHVEDVVAAAATLGYVVYLHTRTGLLRGHSTRKPARDSSLFQGAALMISAGSDIQASQMAGEF